MALYICKRQAPSYIRNHSLYTIAHNHNAWLRHSGNKHQKMMLTDWQQRWCVWEHHRMRMMCQAHLCMTNIVCTTYSIVTTWTIQPKLAIVPYSLVIFLYPFWVVDVWIIICCISGDLHWAITAAGRWHNSAWRQWDDTVASCDPTAQQSSH